MKILLSAYACEPGKGSEPRLGWMWVTYLSKRHEVWVITRANNKPLIEDELRKNPTTKANFLYYDLPPWIRFWKKGRRGYHLYYYLWQVGIYFKFKDFIKRMDFHIIQHITFGNNWQPSFLSLINKSFIWGPVGGENTPWKIFKILPLRAKIKEAFRETMRFIGHHFDPFVRLTAKRAKLILDTSSRWAHSPYPKKERSKIVKFSQNGISPEELPFSLDKILETKERGTFRIVFIGEFVHWKGILFVAEALKDFAAKVDNGWEAILAGYGPEFKRVKKMLENLGDRIKMPGKISMQEVWNTLRDSHVFIYPSFHHGQSTIIMQAMACGLPVICIEGDATAETVEEGAGIVVPLSTKEKIIKGLSEALQKLYHNRELATQMGLKAQSLVFEKYSWEKKVELLEKIYGQVIQNENPHSS